MLPAVKTETVENAVRADLERKALQPLKIDINPTLIPGQGKPFPSVSSGNEKGRNALQRVGKNNIHTDEEFLKAMQRKGYSIVRIEDLEDLKIL